MFTLYLIALVVAFVSSTKAAGVGKAWEVSPVQSPEHHAPLSAWPRMETSPFEVRSISGVGRLAPTDSHHEPFQSERRADKDKSKESNVELKTHQQQQEPEIISTSQLRQSRELEDLDNANVFIPESLFHDPMVEGFFRKTKQVEDVEALPSLWRKFRSLGPRNHGHCSEVEEIDEPYHHEQSKGFHDLEEFDKPHYHEEPKRPHNDEESDKPHQEELEGSRSHEETDRSDDDEESYSEILQDKPRVRREVEQEMEKIAASKNVREARLSSPESWSKQPLSVEFRHRTNLEEPTEDTDKFTKSTSRVFEAPRADFVTANRRSYSQSRESRELTFPASRSFDESPPYRNNLRDRDVDAPFSRGLFYPERYRTERDYFVRGMNEPAYPQERYREVDFDLYGRSRPPMPKPKRIIYYATLPEVVRKPVDLRTYPRPYDTITRSATNVLNQDGFYKRRGVPSLDPGRYRYYSYPYGSSYDNYESYLKKPSWNDRPYVPYTERMEDARTREQGNDRGNMREASRNEQTVMELERNSKMNDRVKSRDQETEPWPVKIGTEVSVKDNERISGRKIFGQREDYDRFHNNGRMDRDREDTGSDERRD